MWVTIIIIGLLAVYIVREIVGTKITEGFGTAIRSDIGDQEEPGWTRDLRYTATFANVQGLPVAGDFCRAISKNGKPDTLQIACALANRAGMDTLEYRSKSVGEGFRMSRDDYWKTTNGKSDYCRLLQDDAGLWHASCAVSSNTGIGPKEFIDTEPPAYIKSLLDAYDGALTWYRWQDDRDDVTGKSAIEVHGSPIFPSMIKPIKTRGLQLNRSTTDDFLAWGEKQTLFLDQDIKPNQIRAICCWVWLDTIEKQGSILHSSNGKQDLVRLSVESGGPYIPPAPLKVAQAIEVRPDHYLVQKSPVQPESDCMGRDDTGGSYSFEIWDKDQRLMRLRAPAMENQWQHVVVTTTDLTTWWPTWQIWVNGTLIDEKKDGRAIPALTLKNNLIGKNLKGCIQDFRVYAKPLNQKKIMSAMAFAKPLLHPSP